MSLVASSHWRPNLTTWDSVTEGILMQQRLRDRSGRLMNLRDSKRVADIERNMARWDEVQLMRSGVVERMVHDDDLEEREAVILVVKDAKPPFLDGRQIFTKQMEPVVPLKDSTSDMAVVARKGSKLVMQVCTFL
jgi:pre-mRNA-splicing factor ATP-dependent RNA helicase DHX38/PRP16